MTSEYEEDLRTTGDAVAADAERLEAIEREKTGLHVSDPRYLELAEEAKHLGERLRVGTRAQEGLARDAMEEGDASP